MVALVRLALLGIGMDHDRPVEDPAGTAIQDPLVVLLAVRMRQQVIDARVVIDMPPPVADVEAVKGDARALPFEPHRDVLAREPRAAGDREARHLAVPGLADR